MDKDKIIKIIKDYNNSQITSDSIELIQEYCIEKGKEPKDVSLFINTLVQMPVLLGNYMPEVIDYYKRKLELIEIKDKNNKLLNII